MSKKGDGTTGTRGKKIIQCVCSDVVNEPDELMLQCTVCKRWLHAECLGIDEYDKPVLEHFVCVFCGTAILVVNSEVNECIRNVPLLGVDNDHIVCCCDEQCESGFMLQCENCGTWQHGRCMNLKDGQTPRNYHCHICRFAKTNKRVDEGKNVTESRKKSKGAKNEKSVNLVETRNEYVYVCKVCGQEFENGQALIYHKTYEKCSQDEEMGESVALSYQDDIVIDLVNAKDTSNGSNNRDIAASGNSRTQEGLFGSPKTTNKQPKLSTNNSRPKSKSLLKRHELAHSNSKLNTSSPKEKVRSATQSTVDNGNVKKPAKLSSPSKNYFPPITTGTTDVTHPPTSSSNSTFSTIHDVQVTDLTSTTEFSQTQRNENTTVACGECSLAFEDPSSLKSHQFNTPNCSSRVSKNATPQRIRQASNETREDQSIKCLCNSNVDRGTMIQCDICKNWQHTSCIGIQEKQDLPTNYCCFDCVNRGYLSVMVKMCEERDISIENISQAFKDKILIESRKRKPPISPIGVKSDAKKIRKKEKEFIVETSSPDSSMESMEATLSGDSSSEDSSANKVVKSKRAETNKTVKKGKTRGSKNTPLVRCSGDEIDAIQEYFSTLLSEHKLFTHLQPKTHNFKQITVDIALELLPPHTDFPQLEITSNFNEEPYTTSLDYLSSLTYPYGNQLIINSGGPVNTLAWVPAVFNKSKHTDTVYLSITTQPDFDSKDHFYVSRGDVIETDTQTADIVQIWGITLSNHLGREARLSLGVVLKQGKVMDMQWCPSGCFDDVIPLEPTELPRLGLLLVALNTGRLGIVAIPHPASLNTNKSEAETDQYPWFENQFFEVNEFDVILEIAPDVSEARIKCLCCDWSIHSGHNRIIAGFQNGSVVVWNLNAKFFCNKSGSVTVCSPIFHVYAHDTAVVCVVWSPQDPCIFATSGQDMSTALLWDTRQPATYIEEMSTFQVCVTWSMCWPLTYLRPICGLELIPNKNAHSWYGNLFTHTYRSVAIKSNNSLSANYPQCPTICSLSWSWEDCSLLLGAFSGELIFLNAFYHARKRSTEHSQPRKIFDISFRTDQEANSLLTDAFDVSLVTSVAFDFDYSCFIGSVTAEFKSSEVAQEALIKRIIKQSVEKSPAPTPSPRNVQDKGECEKCGKKFALEKSLRYHTRHDVCKGGTVNDNRGNFFTPRAATPKRTRTPAQIQTDELMIEQLKEQLSQSKEPNDTPKSTGKSKSGSSKKLHQKTRVSLDTGPEREQPKKREKPRNSYAECTQSKIKQVKWFPCQPYHKIFAVGTGLGIITISAIPGP